MPVTSPKIGILADGSLLSDLGDHLSDLIIDRRCGIRTPFSVEFSRACSCRDHAPTLAPVEQGGAPVQGKLLLASPSVSESTLTDALWRRETRTERSGTASTPEAKDLLIRRARELETTHDLHRVFYAHLKPNIDDRSPENLASLAVKSARSKAGKQRRDGIAYLIDLETEGITTLLMPAYKAEILRQVGAETLRDARRRLLQAGPELSHTHKSSYS